MPDPTSVTRLACPTPPSGITSTSAAGGSCLWRLTACARVRRCAIELTSAPRAALDRSPSYAACSLVDSAALLDAQSTECGAVVDALRARDSCSDAHASCPACRGRSARAASPTRSRCGSTTVAGVGSRRAAAVGARAVGRSCSTHHLGRARRHRVAAFASAGYERPAGGTACRAGSPPGPRGPDRFRGSRGRSDAAGGTRTLAVVRLPPRRCTTTSRVASPICSRVTRNVTRKWQRRSSLAVRRCSSVAPRLRLSETCPRQAREVRAARA